MSAPVVGVRVRRAGQVAGLMLTAAFVLAGCQTRAGRGDGPPGPSTFSNVAFLPFIDARKKPDSAHDFRYFGSLATAAAIADLKFRRRYPVVYSADIGRVADYSARTIEPAPGRIADRAVIRQLGPPGARWLLIPVCENLVYSNLIVGRTAEAKVSLYLFDKQSGSLVWKGTGIGRANAGFLTGLLMDTWDKYALETDVLGMAVFSAGATLPKPTSKDVKSAAGARRAYLFDAGEIRQTSGLDAIAVTAVVDGRRRVNARHDYQPKPIQDEIIRVLRAKGFSAASIPVDAMPVSPRKEEVAFGGAARGRALRAAGSRFVLVPIAEEMGKFPRVGNHYEVSMYLFDTTSGKVIWEGTSFGSTAESSILALQKGFPERKELAN